MNKKKKMNFKVIGRLFKELFSYYPKMLPITIVCILFNAVISSIPSVFMQNVIAEIEKYVSTGDWAAAQGPILSLVMTLGGLYLISIITGIVYQQLIAIIGQGSLQKLRSKMFRKMETLPIRYFDTNSHGDIMSYYTNDIDTLRQLISQSIPSLITASVTVITIFSIMAYYSIWLLLVVLIGVVIMLFVIKYVGGNSGRYFMAQQQAIAKAEGYIEEMMNGQKVVKVFNHEEKAMEAFEKIDDELCEVSTQANKYANILMPILHNIGNILYVLVAIVAGVLMAANVQNLSISGLILDVSIVVPFLNMTKQFTGNIQNLSQQFNSIIMACAGCERIFELIDETPEEDEGNVIFVRAKKHADGTLTEVSERTGTWAWKVPQEDGTFKYVELIGDVRFDHIDFAYRPGHTILHDVTLFAKPGQKLAFVGATGAGKTTITNLVNRFYDIADGKIKYDGININDIKKSYLRKSMGIVLQETCLFTNTVRENIRYGRLTASDDEVIEAAKLAGAHDFITRLPQGYDTIIHGNNDSLSQGQRQLIAIARAAIAQSPVMILDEATSSIDTRTEEIVQKGLDNLMEGRTVFVIAHRLSTVRNSNAIMVLDHGRIIERGSHDELIAQKGNYYQLYTGAFELE